MRTVKEPDVRKQEILEGAIRVFAKNSYDKTTIADIARELKISQGLCYRYFPSKEAIYDAALEKYADMIANDNRQIVNMDLPIRQLVDELTSNLNYRNAEKKDEGLYHLFHSENSRRMHDELSLRVAKKVIPMVQERLRRAGERGEITVEDTDAIAIFGVFSWVGIFMTENLTDKERLKKIRFAWYQLLGL
ncbi:MAG: TetR/AcrR family transcriptional regulator [Lachnospiraceae bacterium]|nr:TetR/AcrR family transcriptional regulator [Lachnospiraceae bacterium]